MNKENTITFIVSLVSTIVLGVIIFSWLISSNYSLIEKIAFFMCYTLWCFSIGMILVINEMKENKK